MTQESIDALRAERDLLAGALADRTAQLAAVTKEFEQFTQSVSHDLRAPLRALEGFAQILMEDYGEKFDADGRRCVETMAAGAHKASALIEDLHGFARLSGRPFHPAVIDLRELAEHKADELKAEGSVAQFRVDVMPEAWGDPDLLETIVEELLRNAVKFSRRQAHPSIEVSGQSGDGDTVYSVRDNGMGFDPRYADRLFGVFQRLHEDKDIEGRGIGLAKVQHLVHRHGGRVWAEGKLNGGAAFFFSLPARPL
ncbi:MAG TPA: ATP-binding protein [Candidatus Cybelea sp.]|nr:ATP-binding protein [Candidatus Cybelea sp.]